MSRYTTDGIRSFRDWVDGMIAGPYAGWPDTGALMRRLDDGSSAKDGKPGNMYRHLGADDAERQKNLKLFKEWVGNWTHKRFPELTKEDLAGVTVPY